MVDFATEKLLEVKSPDNNMPLEVIINDEARQFIGGVRVYNWHRGDTYCADVIASALMGLEKYLYDCIEKKEDVSQSLKQILSKSKSIAFVGLACEVGRYKPELFIDILRPLLAVPELYFWEDYYRLQNDMNST